MTIWGKPILADLQTILNLLKADAKAQGLGTHLDKILPTGHDIFVTCPRYDLHGGHERTPSCSISKEEGLVHCFGCGYASSLPDVVARVLGLANAVEGYKWIAKHFPTPTVGQREAIGVGKSREVSKTVLDESVLARYNFDHPYMFKRGLNGETIDWFDVGYDEETKSITFPMRDSDGKLLFIKKRPITTRQIGKYEIESGADKRELLYGLFMVKRCRSVVDMVYISEGEFDTLSWYCIDCFGVGAQGSTLFPEQIEALLRIYRRGKVCLAFDNDKAGYRCKYEAIEKLTPYFELYELAYPRDQFFKDPNDLLVAGRLKADMVKRIGL